MRLRWLLFGMAAGALVAAERLRPLRRAKEPGPERIGRNLAIGKGKPFTPFASTDERHRPGQSRRRLTHCLLVRHLPKLRRTGWAGR